MSDVEEWLAETELQHTGNPSRLPLERDRSSGAWSRESVDKALALFERAGVIEAGQRCVTITNYERLRARAGLTAA